MSGIDLDASMLPVGAILRRTYGGEVHVVEVVLPRVKIARRRDREVASRRRWWRYMYRGKVYKTLTAIAREITGDPTMSGNRFFGLRRLRR